MTELTVAYEQFDPGDPGCWCARDAGGNVVGANYKLLSTDEDGARRWARTLDVTIPIPAWTPATEALLMRHVGGWGAPLVLRTLAEAGLLVTPQVRAVLDAARAWRAMRADTPPGAAPPKSESAALIAAVDALPTEETA